MADFNESVNSYKRYCNTLAKVNEQNKTAVFDALAAAGVTIVTVEFDGEGDSGQIEAITACAGETSVTLPTTPVTLTQASWQNDSLAIATEPLSTAIETLCYDFLEQQHGGWENNDGGFGKFTLDVAKREIELDFNARFSDYTNYSHTF